jgi:hypothetical protein
MRRQALIENGSIPADDFITEHLLENITEISRHPFGNYFIQALINKISQDNVRLLLFAIKEDLLLISINNYGTRVIQSLIGNLKTLENINIFNTFLIPHVLDLVKNDHANHIISKYFEELDIQINNEIFRLIINNIDEIAINKNGCCVLQKCLSQLNYNLKVRQII